MPGRLLQNGHMPKLMTGIFALLLAFQLSSCRAPEEHRAEYFVFGTLVEVIVRESDEQDATRAFNDLQQRFQAMHQDWHAWEPGALTRINRAFSEGRPATVPAGIETLIRRSQELEILTGGRFNAALGAMIDLWGFHSSEFPVHAPVPAAQAIQLLLDAAPSAADIVIDDGMVYSANPAVQLDFGAIAKGYAVDLALEILADHGIENALVNAGGDLKASGGSPERPWTVGIRGLAGSVIGGVEITATEAVFTSGVDQRFLEHNGERYPHILDPSTGLPVTGVASVTVIAREALLADVAATALIVAGRDSWVEVARALGLKDILLIDDRGEIYLTAAMNERLILAPGSKPELNIVNQYSP